MNIESVATIFASEGFAVKCFETKEEAADYLVSSFNGEVIGMGGSRTLNQLEIYDRLCENNTAWWHQEDPRSRRMFGDFTVYITGANAISETGEIVNIDGTGNRIGSTFFGPKKVVFVVGKNKITPDLPSAMKRAQIIAGPPNAKRLGKKTPCSVTGKCHNCKSPDRICRGMSIHMRPMKAFEETEIVFINEELGY